MQVIGANVRGSELRECLDLVESQLFGHAEVHLPVQIQNTLASSKQRTVAPFFWTKWANYHY